MSAEAQAAELYVRIVGQGISEMIRISSTVAMTAGRGAVALAMYCYALKRGGSPKEIARNPSGMAIVTIPEEKLEEFQTVAKPYHFNFFTVNNPDYEKGYADICLKVEDLSTCQRVLEMAGISAVTRVENYVEQSTKEEQVIEAAQTFEDARKELEPYRQDAEAAFNRITSKDYSRNEPYCLCDINHPENYVIVSPQKAVFDGEEYTKSTYTVFKDSKKTGQFNDGRFAGRKPDFWPRERERIMEASGMNNGDIVYLKNTTALYAYQALAKGEENPMKAAEVNFTAHPSAKETDGLEKSMESLSKKAVPVQAQDGSFQTMASETGQKNTKSGNTITNGDEPAAKPGGVKEFAENYKMSEEALEISKELRKWVQQQKGVAPK